MTNIKIFECEKCNKKYVQRKWICPTCQHTEFREKEVSGLGSVFSFTRIHVSSPEFAHLTPYTVALIDLEDGVRITGRIQEEVNINDKVSCISTQDHSYLFTKTNE